MEPRDQPGRQRAVEHANELRRCLAMSFSGVELTDFAHRLGVELLAGAGGTDDSARILVRTMMRRGQLAQLLDQLRQVKPLVEWPSPPAEVPASPPFATEEAELTPVEEPSDEAKLVPAEELAPAEVPTDDAEGGALAKGSALPEAAGGDGRDPSRATGAAAGPAAPLLDPFVADDMDAGRSSPWRTGRVRTAALLCGVALIVVAAVIGGFALGRGGAPESQPSRPGTSRTSDHPDEPARIAARAAGVLSRSIREVEDGCDVEGSTEQAAQALAHAFRHCRTGVSPPPQPSLPRPPLDPVPTTTATARPAAPPVRPQIGGPNRCMERCAQQHSRCKLSQCGPEPKLASEYPAYQRCCGHCLRLNSSCKRTCP